MNEQARQVWHLTYTAYINRGKTAEDAIAAADKAADALTKKFGDDQPGAAAS